MATILISESDNKQTSTNEKTDVSLPNKIKSIGRNENNKDDNNRKRSLQTEIECAHTQTHTHTHTHIENPSK